jgi:hypothetical protein
MNKKYEKLQLAPNDKPVEVQIAYDSPKEFDDKYHAGQKTYSYGVRVDGKLKYFSANEAHHKQIQDLGMTKDLWMIISRPQKAGEKFSHYEFSLPSDEPFASKPKVKKETEPTYKEDKPDWEGKEKRMFRSAVVKSLIERGTEITDENAKSVFKEFDRWYSMIMEYETVKKKLK